MSESDEQKGAETSNTAGPKYTIIARFEAKPGCEDELREILLETARYALAEEPSCERFEILQATDEDGRPMPNVFMTNELFHDFDGVEAHRGSWRTPIRIDRLRPLRVASRIEHAILLTD
ncbi:antibiotic biosynthesis monooxygenase family protein [Streptomyces sp. NPDC046909]|uniref:putative quinol monooxygenase n=1 Tax=Streptomyces sp. NPDC046909 TaxID=3155617 RepID=UPI0033CA774F